MVVPVHTRTRLYSDDYNTPERAYKHIAPWIPSGVTVWDPFYFSGAAKERLERCLPGRTIVHEDKDAYTEAPDAFDYIVTNPPFSEKLKAIGACLQYGKPCFMLMPIETVMRRFMDPFPMPALIGCRSHFVFDNPSQAAKAPACVAVWMCWNVPGLEPGSFKLTAWDSCLPPPPPPAQAPAQPAS